MNENTTAELKSRLEAIRRELVGDLEKTIETSKNDEFTGLVPDIVDDAARSFSRQLLLNLGEQERDKLKLVEDALAKIQNGDFGVCERCEEPIPAQRLNIVPFARYCVQCLEAVEREDKIQRGLKASGDESVYKY